MVAGAFNTRLAQANLITKEDFDTRLSSLNRKITLNKTKHLLVENELKKLKTIVSSYFIGKSHFEEDGTQNYLVFQPLYWYFRWIASIDNGNCIYYWQSGGLSDERIISVKPSSLSITPFLDNYGTKTRVEFNGSCLKQNKIRYTHGKIVNIYIFYETSKNNNISNYPSLENCLFGAVSLTRNADIDRYGYSGHRIGFDRHGSFLFLGIGLGWNVIVFGADMSSLTKIDNRKKYILILAKSPTEGLEHTLNAEKNY